MPEIKRRIALRWAALGKGDNIIGSRKADMNSKIKRKVLNEYVIPVVTYGSETLALTTAQRDAVEVAQRNTHGTKEMRQVKGVSKELIHWRQVLDEKGRVKHLLWLEEATLFREGTYYKRNCRFK